MDPLRPVDRIPPSAERIEAMRRLHPLERERDRAQREREARERERERRERERELAEGARAPADEADGDDGPHIDVRA
jgi:hypothetical protein